MNMKEPVKEADNTDWQKDVRIMLERLIEEYELPTGSLYLSDSYSQRGKNTGELISHTIYIWEPDYPPTPGEKPEQNKLIITIVPSSVKKRPDDLDLYIREEQEGNLHEFLPKEAKLIRTESDIRNGQVKIRIKKQSPSLVGYIKENVIYCIKGYMSKATRFGCCSSFVKCSDEKRCVHENKLYAKACMYRDHLDRGEIFYGKNKNID